MIEKELRGHFLALYRMALADARIDYRELEQLFFIGEKKGVSKEQLEKWLLTPCDMPEYLPVTIEKKIEFLYDMARIIVADEEVDEKEKEVLKNYCMKMEFDASIIEETVDFLIENALQNKPLQYIYELLENEES